MKPIITAIVCAALAGVVFAQDYTVITKEAATVSEMTVQTNMTVGGTLAVTGASTLSGAVTASTSVSSPSATAGTLAVQTNATVGGTLGVTGASTMTGTVNVNAIDGVGAVDIDYGSADITDHSFTSDGGTVVLDGTIVASDDITADSLILVDAATAAPTNSASAGFAITVNGTNYWLELFPAND